MSPLIRYLRFPFKSTLRNKANDDLFIQEKMDKERIKFKTAMVSGVSYDKLKEIGSGIDFLKSWLKKEAEKKEPKTPPET